MHDDELLKKLVLDNEKKLLEAQNQTARRQGVL